MLGTGMRVGEIVGLRWCDINFEENLISVNHTYIDTLRKMFLIEYNAYLFGKKQERMAELLDTAIKKGIVSGKIYPTRKNDCADNKPKPQKTTLKCIYKTNNKLNSSINQQQLCVPILLII